MSVILFIFPNEKYSVVQHSFSSCLHVYVIVWYYMNRCIEVVKNSVHSELASELEITKALTFLREKDLPRVIKCKNKQMKCHYFDITYRQ